MSARAPVCQSASLPERQFARAPVCQSASLPECQFARVPVCQSASFARSPDTLANEHSKTTGTLEKYSYKYTLFGVWYSESLDDVRHI